VKRTQRVTFGHAKNASTEGARPQSESHVITLCSVPVPITIPRPRSPLLNRFSFFSTPRPDHCDCYWVHVGYFPTRAEAQRWVRILRRHYPDAFVGETRELIPHCAADAQDGTRVRGLPIHVDADGLDQTQCTTLTACDLLN
jgi:hypothetical protein